jgi:2-keto-4-pentenoate hydratase
LSFAVEVDMHSDLTRAIVDRLEGHVKHRTRFQLYRIDEQPLTMADAYSIQDEILARALRSGSGGIAGYKVGLTTGKMQQFCGVNEPIAGRILKSGVHASGARLKKSQFHRLGIESELALRIGSELPPIQADSHGHELLECIDAIAAAFEVIDDRDADYAQLEASSIAAENSWNKGIVLGEAAPPAAFGDLTGLEGRLLVNGEHIATGTSSDVMNGPLWVLAWVARFAQRAGTPLRPGQWIMTGSIIPTKFAIPGDSYTFQLGSLPPVTAAIV